MHPNAPINYPGFLSEVVRKYIQVFGFDIVSALTKHVTRVKIHADGTIIRINAPEDVVTTEILSLLHMLSDSAYEQLVLPTLEKYPEIETALNPSLITSHQSEKHERATENAQA